MPIAFSISSMYQYWKWLAVWNGKGLACKTRVCWRGPGILAIHSEVGLSVFLHSQKQRKNLPLYLLQRLVTNGLKSFQVSQPGLYMYPAWPPDHSSLDSRPFQPQFQTMSDLTPDHSSLNSRPFQPQLQTISVLTPDHSSLNSRPFQPLNSRPFQS